MRNPAVDYNVVTITLATPTGDFLRALEAVTHQSKNLYNTALFVIRQINTAYEYNNITKISNLKADLHPSQTQAIEHVNKAVVKINESRLQKYPAQIKKNPDAKLKQIELLGTTGNPLYTMLDLTVLDNALRTWEDTNGKTVYSSMPAVMAQQVLKKVLENYQSFFAGLKQFQTSPAGMTGRPRPPKYLFKHARFLLEIPLVAVHDGHLPSLKGKKIAENYYNTSFLPEELLPTFSAFDVNQAIFNACKTRGWAKYQPQCLRIVPTRNGIKLEVVVRVEGAYPEKSFLAKLTTIHGEQLAAIKEPKKRDKWLLEFLKNTPVDEMPRIAAADLGVNNLVTVAFSTGHKAHIYSSGRFESVLCDFNEQLDNLVSKRTPLRARQLQGKKNALLAKNEKLSKAEHLELNGLLKIVYAHPTYRKLLGKKNRWISDFLHKTSCSIVKEAVDKKISVIVIGRNIGWKQESNMGRVQNRRFSQIAHATLIKLITYKAEHHGIAVVLTEESYTSKTSFVTNEALEVYNKETRNDPTRTKPVRDGYRRSDDRNMFVHKQQRNDRWKIVHADVNGAFNIIRKVFKNFAYHVGLTLKFTIFRLSPRLGTVRMFS